MKWIIVVLAVLNFGYMVVDGSRALLSGDYIRPGSGQYAGQLGPWSNLVNKVGIDPESSLMKVIFVAWGLVGSFITVAYALDKPWAWTALLIVNVASLWYAMVGTISSLVQIVLLCVLKLLR